MGGRYRVVARLAAGGMGAVYTAVQESLSREVALKVIRTDLIDERFRRRFAVETEATRRLQHDSIVRLLDSGILEPDDVTRHTGVPFLILELLAGRNLHDELQANGVMPWPRAVQVLQQIAHALEVAHQHHVVHRDLKPRNVFLVESSGDGVQAAPRVKVLDFGIAKILDDDSAGVKTTTGIVLGTPGYVPPERMRGEPDDPRSDLYALGALAWDMVAGRGPLVAPTQILLSVKHMTERPPNLLTVADVPDDLALLVGELLEKTPARRPQSAAHVVARLAALLSAA